MNKWKSDTWTVEKDMNVVDHRSYTHNLAVVKLKPEKSSGLNGISKTWPLRYQFSEDG